LNASSDGAEVIYKVKTSISKTLCKHIN